MRILFAIDGLRSGGKERRFLSLLNELVSDKKFEIELILFNTDIHYTEVFKIDIKRHFLIRKTSKDISILYKFFKITKKFKPDVIHSWDTLSNLYSIPTAKLLGIKLITSKITDAPPHYNRFTIFGILSEICFKTADLILSNSIAGMKSYKIKTAKSRVIYNGFDMKRLTSLKDKDELLKDLNINQKILITMVASFSENKDYNSFLEAAIMINGTNSDIAFVCVGDGPLRENLQKKFERKGVYFLGRRNDIENIMNVSDIGVLMSNNDKHGEGISNSLLEFMALGKPVIASNNGGNNELIVDNISGLILKENSVTELINNIMTLLNNRVRYKQMGIEAKMRIIKEFSLDRMVEEFKAVYKIVEK